LKLHSGVVDGHNIVMPGRGSYDVDNNKHRDICFRFKYDIKEPYTIKGNDVHYKYQLTIEELLAGFVKDIEVYKTKICIKSDRYFNPEKAAIIKNLGLNHPKKGTGNLVINFEIKWTDSVRLEKYKDVLTKIIRPNNDTTSQCESIYDINEICSVQQQP
jgi:DnaJ-class molecular chaperone